jgi:hypothetical protein
MAVVDSQWTITLHPDLHPFVELVLNNPLLQQRLAPIAETDAFIAEALSIATKQGIVLDSSILKTVLRPDPLGIGRFAAAPIIGNAWPPNAWLPTRSLPTSGAPAFDWLWFGDRRLLHPFFEDEVRRAASLPFNWLFRIRTSMETVIAGAGGEREIPLHGLIFHMSRCGSTLLAQMLAAVPSHAVSSEPEPIDGVIQWARLGQVDNETALTAIRAIVAALGRDRGTGAERHIIKLEAWQAFSLPLFRTAFPTVNWVHLHRNSVEVLVSTMQQPGVHTAPGMLPEHIVGFPVDAIMSLEDFAARVLSGIGEAIIKHQDLGGGLIIEKAAAGPIADHFSLSLDTESAAMMKAAARRDSKDPQQGFSSDAARKQAAATDTMRSAAARWMQPVEQRLLQLSRTAE